MKCWFAVAALLAWLAKPELSLAQSEVSPLSFGDWRIQKIEANNTYALTGVGEVKGDTQKFAGTRYFDILCYPIDHKISILIPYDKYPEFRSDRDSAHVVTYWNDNAAPKDLPAYLVSKYMLATIGGGTDIKRSRAIDAFVASLESGKHRFSISFEGKSVHFDLADFQSAYARFRQLCNLR